MAICINFIEDSDLIDLTFFVSDPEVAKYLTWKAYTDSREIHNFFRKSMASRSFPDIYFAIRKDGRLIGTIHFIERENGHVQFGLGIRPPYWGYGIGKEVVALCKEYLRTNWPVRISEIWADVHIMNQRAIKLFLHSGFLLQKKHIKDHYDRYVYKFNSL